MELTVHGKQIDVGDSLRGHVREKIEDLNQKYFNHTTFANITFSKEGHGHHRTRAHISIKLGKNIMVVADAIETDPYIAFDAAAEKAGKQLRRYKRRLRDHHERPEETSAGETPSARDYVLADGHDKDEAPEAPVVIAEMTTTIETLTVSDAVMRMDLGDLSALLFYNAKHNGLNMIFRRPDGHVGWVDPGICTMGKKPGMNKSIARQSAPAKATVKTSAKSSAKKAAKKPSKTKSKTGAKRPGKAKKKKK